MLKQRVDFLPCPRGQPKALAQRLHSPSGLSSCFAGFLQLTKQLESYELGTGCKERGPGNVHGGQAAQRPGAALTGAASGWLGPARHHTGTEARSTSTSITKTGLVFQGFSKK